MGIELHLFGSKPFMDRALTATPDLDADTTLVVGAQTTYAALPTLGSEASHYRRVVAHVDDIFGRHYREKPALASTELEPFSDVLFYYWADANESAPPGVVPLKLNNTLDKTFTK